MSNPWFRMYSEFIYNETIEFLSFEDQRHFVFILCMKNEGLLDKKYPQSGMLDRVVSRRLGLVGEAFDNAKRRIKEVGLIDENWQPVKWDERQFKSDSSKERTKAYRDRLKSHCDVTVTAQEADTEEDTDSESESDLKTHTIKPSVCDFPTTPAGICCKAMIKQGIKITNQYNPLFIALLEAGATEQEFANAAKTAVSKGKPDFAYAIGIVKKQREDAAKLILHRGPLPTKQESLEQENKETTQRAKARLFGMQTEKDITNETTRL